MSASAAAQEKLQGLAAKARIPGTSDRVYKDECVFSFDTPESEDGLYVCLNTFLGFSKKYVQVYHEKTGNSLFLHLKTIKTEEVSAEENEEIPRKKLTTLGIGVEGGAPADVSYTYEYFNQLIILPDFEGVALSDPSIPAQIQASVAGVLAAESSARKDDNTSWELERVVSKCAENLLQLDNGIKIPPSGWKCEMCDITDNLWLNLTDGSVLCGRKFFDGTGGNNHAVEHYEQVKHPLAVKLGTITPEGADVYSYVEDDMVIDPYLQKHLLHFGIDMNKMKKTVVSMAEMELELNRSLQFEFDKIQESGRKLEPLFGPGHTGLYNLGNTCYMNSVLQVLYSFKDVSERYYEPREAIFSANCTGQPADNLEVQLAKLGHGLLSGEYSKPTDSQDQEGITPKMFKHLVGKGHPEFSTNAQQDALEYLQHVLDKIERSNHGSGKADVTSMFKFEWEKRIECGASHKVRYMYEGDMNIGIDVDLDSAVNKAEVEAYNAKVEEAKAAGQKVTEDPVRPKIMFETAFQRTFAVQRIEDFKSPATKEQTFALASTKFKTFPKVLVLTVRKFYMDSDWQSKKKDVSLVFPDEIDLTSFKGSGMQPGEEPLPEGGDEAPAPTIDEGMVAQLAGMGFAYEGCKKAVYHNPTNVEAAMEWVMAHMADPDFDQPLVVPGSKKTADANAAKPEDIATVCSMGFTEAQAKKALAATSNNVERAVDWIFSHMDELNAPDEPASAEAAVGGDVPSASGKYRLKAFISHGGKSTQMGHYVCHIRKEGQWVIFNDRKVAQSVEPPLDAGYLYFYEAI